jgi:hypothetical protein
LGQAAAVTTEVMATSLSGHHEDDDLVCVTSADCDYVSKHPERFHEHERELLTVGTQVKWRLLKRCRLGYRERYYTERDERIKLAKEKAELLSQITLSKAQLEQPSRQAEKGASARYESEQDSPCKVHRIPIPDPDVKNPDIGTSGPDIGIFFGKFFFFFILCF